MNGVTTQAPKIGTGSIVEEYPDAKSIIGEGSFGVVFATRRGQSREAFTLPTAMEKLIHESQEFREHFVISCRGNLRPLHDATSIHILTGCLCPDLGLRIRLHSLVAAAGRLLLGIRQEQKKTTMPKQRRRH